MAGRWWLWLVVAAGVAQAQVGLEPGVDLQGRVVDDQGQPQAGVYVRLEQADSGEESLARTDAEGRFTLTDLVRDGDYELTVVEDLGGVGEEDFYVYRGYVRLSRTVAAADLPLTGWEIVVPAVQRMTLRGRVVDDEGRPVAGATVRLKGGVAARDDIIEFDLTTAADGTYEAANLPTDVLLQANVHVPGYVPEQVRDLVPGERVFPDLQVASTPEGGEFKLRAAIKPEAMRKVQEQALKQNMTTLHNRINELGVAEPVIQQQGLDRIVVQLPGVQDTAKAKDILGRTATLEVRMVDESSEARSAEMGSGPVPFGAEKYNDRNGQSLIVKKQVVLTGENLTDAQPGFDSQTQEPTVNLTLDAKGSRIFKDVTRENVGKRMAIILFEKGKGEVVTAPVIRSEIGGGRVQISGRMTTVEANDTSLLLRAGSLAAPMEIIEEYTIGPSLGADNINRGIHSVVWGMVAIAVFMCLYYMVFGVISTIALGVNVLLLLAILSMLQATLTLPGIAAMALAGGQQMLLVIDKTPHGLKQNVLEPVHFVPLKSGIA